MRRATVPSSRSPGMYPACSVPPLSSGTLVLRDRDWAGVRVHPGRVQLSLQMVDLVENESSKATLVAGHLPGAVQRAVLHGDHQRSWHHPAHVKERKAALVLFVLVHRLVDGPGVVEEERTPAVRRLDDRDRSCRSNLRRCDPHPLSEYVNLGQLVEKIR